MIISRYPDETDREWIEHVSRKTALLWEQGDIWLTDFLSPGRRHIFEEILWRDRRFNHLVYGGYPGAGRVRVKVWPKGLNVPEELPPVKLLLLSYKEKESPVPARDIKIALLELGVPVSMTGDHTIIDGVSGLYIQEEAVPLISGRLPVVGNVPVEWELKDLSVRGEIPVEGKQIKGTVASPRLDAVLSRGFGLSRSRAAGSIQGGQVQLNWQVILDSSRKVKVNDVIIYRGTALKVESISGKTRKGRQHIILKKQ